MHMYHLSNIINKRTIENRLSTLPCFLLCSVFSEELEFLQNVYLDELTYDPQSCDQSGHTLQFHVTPSTGDDKERQYVYLVLNIFVPTEVSQATKFVTWFPDMKTQL